LRVSCHPRRLLSLQGGFDNCVQTRPTELVTRGSTVIIVAVTRFVLDHGLAKAELIGDVCPLSIPPPPMVDTAGRTA
jgi:hypothetical protein